MEQMAAIRCTGGPKGPFVLRLPCELYTPEEVDADVERMKTWGFDNVTLEIERRDDSWLEQVAGVDDVRDFFAGGDTDAVATEWEQNPARRRSMVAAIVAEAKNDLGLDLSADAVTAYLDSIVYEAPHAQGGSAYGEA